MTKNKIEDIPGEVWQVHAIIYAGQPVGTTMYKHCQDIIDKYPQHFPWEHAYKKVPEEVHAAYRKEMGYDFGTILKEMPVFDNKGGGIMAAIEADEKQRQKQAEENNKKPLDQQLREAWDAMGKREDEARAAALNHKRVWNKHYGKYKLEFKPNLHERKYLL